MSGAGERSKLKYVHCRCCELSTPEECDGLYLTDEMADLNERKIAAESEAALQQRENATLRARLAESSARVRELEAALGEIRRMVHTHHPVISGYVVGQLCRVLDAALRDAEEHDDRGRCLHEASP